MAASVGKGVLLGRTVMFPRIAMLHTTMFGTKGHKGSE
jgi:hypothetical protein